MLDFATTLIEAGLVAAVDDIPIGPTSTGVAHNWLAGVPAELVKPLFSRPAWIVYGGLLVFCLALFALQPRYWPSVEDFFFYPDPAICAVVMLVTLESSEPARKSLP